MNDEIESGFKQAVLEALGRSPEAMVAMTKGLPYANLNEVYAYGRTLTRSKKGKQAFDIFKMNYDKHPDQFLTNVGMARGYSALGEYKKALPFAQKAQAQAPNKPNKDLVDKMVTNLKDGKDIN